MRGHREEEVLACCLRKNLGRVGQVGALQRVRAMVSFPAGTGPALWRNQAEVVVNIVIPASVIC